MLKARWKLLIKKIGFYTPFTGYFVLFALISFFGYKWLQNKAAIPDSAYKDIFILLLSLALWVGLIILIFGLFTVFVSFLFFKWKQKKNEVKFKIEIPSAGEQVQQPVIMNIHPVLKPFLGFIKIRLNYDETHFSEKFSLVKRTKNKFFNTTLEGVYNWTLPEIKEYQVEKVIIYFEDFFQFFSFALSVNTKNSFHTKPQTETLRTIKAFPRKTMDATTRIDELRRVEGELINYKNFESNDDVRRIVWKIYARNKELVVRIPEIMDPYSSHIYFYASFFSHFDVKGNEVMEVPFLNYYKTICWSVYKQLSQKGLEVRYITDQDIPKNKMEKPEEQVKYSITASNWHSDTELKEYVKPKDASIVMISSLSDIAQVKDLIERYGNDISFLMVPLSESFNKQHIGDWLQWVFVQQEKDKSAVYKTNWSLSLLRNKILNNEKELTALLKDYQKSGVLESGA